MQKEKDDIIISRIRATLRGMPFPSDKKGVIDYARNSGVDNGVIDRLDRISDRQYVNSDDVADEAEQWAGQ